MKRTPKTTKLRLSGPTTLAEGRDLAAELNAVVATFNTLYFMAPDGTLQTPRISVKTDPPS
jgi:hypothetical protein